MGGSRLGPLVARGSVPRQQPKALSTDAAFAGGPARSSCEAPARWGGGGAKGSAHQDLLLRSTRGGQLLGGREGKCQRLASSSRTTSINKQVGRSTGRRRQTRE